MHRAAVSSGPELHAGEAAGDAGVSFASRLLLSVALTVAFAGLFAAGVLGLGHLLDLPVPCGQSRGCQTVASHPASRVMGVPIAYVGVVAYLVLIGVLLRVPYARRARLALLLLSGAGALASVGLLAYSKLVIQATCLWCVGSGVAMLLLFLLSVVAWRRGGALRPPRPLLFWGLVMLLAAGLGIQAAGMENTARKPPVPSQVLASVLPSELAASGKSLGPEDAPLTVIIFADLQCPACAGAHAALHQFQAAAPDRVRLVYRHYPLGERSGAAAALSEIAAEQGKFWEFVKAVYAQPGLLHREGLLTLMTALGLDAEAAEQRVADAEDPAIDRLNADIALANRLGIHATPTFVLVLQGFPPVSANQRTLPEMLNSAPVQAALALP
jgi:protein-disulfide isomerase